MIVKTEQPLEKYEDCVKSVDFWVPDTRLGTKYSWVLEYHLSIRSELE